MKNVLFEKIKETTFTTQDLHRRIALLKRYLSALLFHAEIALDDVDINDRAWLANFIGFDPTLLDQAKLPLMLRGITATTLNRVFDKLETQAKEADHFTLFLATHLPLTQLNAIGNDLRRTNSEAFVDIKIDPTLIAGAALAIDGQYRDYSLKAKLEAKHEEIQQSIKKYIREGK